MLWFSVSRHLKQIKIKIKTVQQIKSGIWEIKGGKYTKTLAKIQARRIFRIRDIRRNVLPKFTQICMETPCWCPPGWAPTWRTETNKNICYRVLVKKREFIPRGIHKHKSNTFLLHELFRQQNCPKYVTFVTYRTAARPSCECHVTQQLRNSSVLYHQTKNPFKAKICMKISFQLI